MTDFPALIAKLEAWKEYDFHKDRQLADEVLIADGWKCEPDASFEDGVRWYVGTNPQYSTSEGSRPHLIHDLDTALGVVPSGHNVEVMITARIGAAARVWPDGKATRFTSRAPIATIAVLIAALKAKQALEES